MRDNRLMENVKFGPIDHQRINGAHSSKQRKKKVVRSIIPIEHGWTPKMKVQPQTKTSTALNTLGLNENESTFLYQRDESMFSSSNPLANETIIVRKLVINQPVHICIVHECDLPGKYSCCTWDYWKPPARFVRFLWHFEFQKVICLPTWIGNWQFSNWKIFPIRENWENQLLFAGRCGFQQLNGPKADSYLQSFFLRIEKRPAHYEYK